MILRNVYYLAKVIKENTNENFNDYVRLKRIEAAKRLIAGGCCTIEEVAHSVGFTYTHYFIKVFRSIEGITPGQYRERCQR